MSNDEKNDERYKESEHVPRGIVIPPHEGEYGRQKGMSVEDPLEVIDDEAVLDEEDKKKIVPRAIQVQKLEAEKQTEREAALRAVEPPATSTVHEKSSKTNDTGATAAKKPKSDVESVSDETNAPEPSQQVQEEVPPSRQGTPPGISAMGAPPSRWPLD